MDITSGIGGSSSGTLPIGGATTAAGSAGSQTGSSASGGANSNGNGNGNSNSISPVPTLSRSEQRKAKAVSDAIDKSLRADKDRLQKERGAKLLILGKPLTL